MTQRLIAGRVPSRYNPQPRCTEAGVAQMVEQRIRNAKVASSIPAAGTSNTKGFGIIVITNYLSLAQFWHTRPENKILL